MGLCGLQVTLSALSSLDDMARLRIIASSCSYQPACGSCGRWVALLLRWQIMHWICLLLSLSAVCLLLR